MSRKQSKDQHRRIKHPHYSDNRRSVKGWRRWTTGSHPQPPNTAPNWKYTRSVLTQKLRGKRIHDRNLATVIPRSRIRVGPDVSTSSGQLWVNGDLQPEEFYSSPVKRETMFDILNGKKWLSNRCQHDSFSVLLPTGSVNVPPSGRILFGGSIPYATEVVIPTTLSRISMDISPYPHGHLTAPSSPYPDGYVEFVESVSDLHAEAWSVMSSVLNKNDVDILDFLYELPQLKFLWKDWVKDSHNWSMLTRACVGAASAKDSLRVISNANLAYQFGLAPFVSDCSNLYIRLRDIRDNMSKFLQDAGVYQTRHFSRHRLFTDVTPSGTFLQCENPEENVGIYFRRTISVDYHATSTFMYTLPDTQSVWSTLSKYLTYMGVSLDARTIWEEIPFSFVVDWFYNVGKFLHFHKFDLYKINVMLADFNYSIKSTYSITSVLTYKGKEYPGCSSKLISYTRNRAVPSGYDRVETGAFSLNRFGLAASLGGQKLSSH